MARKFKRHLKLTCCIWKTKWFCHEWWRHNCSIWFSKKVESCTYVRLTHMGCLCHGCFRWQHQRLEPRGTFAITHSTPTSSTHSNFHEKERKTPSPGDMSIMQSFTIKCNFFSFLISIFFSLSHCSFFLSISTHLLQSLTSFTFPSLCLSSSSLAPIRIII